MVQYRYGTINSTTALIASGVNLALGFIPDRFQIWNTSILQVNPPNSATVASTLWLKGMPDASALMTTYTAGAPTVSYITSAGITPINLGGSWQNTIYTITGISNANPGVVTLSSLTPTNSKTLVNGMTITISGVKGMTGLNTNRFIVSNVGVDGATKFRLYDTFGNPVDTTGLGTYVSGGQCDVISYPPTAPILDSVNGQVITPGSPAGLQLDVGFEGLLIGPSTSGNILGANGNVLRWEAIFQTPTGW
jgi:hypothetical protein